MSWAELFERAAECSVTEDSICDALARRREGLSKPSEGDEVRGNEEGDHE